MYFIFYNFLLCFETFSRCFCRIGCLLDFFFCILLSLVIRILQIKYSNLIIRLLFGCPGYLEFQILFFIFCFLFSLLLIRLVRILLWSCCRFVQFFEMIVVIKNILMDRDWICLWSSQLFHIFVGLNLILFLKNSFDQNYLTSLKFIILHFFQSLFLFKFHFSFEILSDYLTIKLLSLLIIVYKNFIKCH